MECLIETQGLVKQYGKKRAVNQVSIHIQKGDIYGLIGKNGAGKTTLMRLLLGLTKPDAGNMRLFGGADLNWARQRIGALIETPALYKNETALENMKRFAILAPTTDEEIHQLLALVGLADTGKKKVKAFSLGMRQRLGIAVALLGHPEVLILDEPINGLDPSGIKEIRDLILELNKRGVTFLISSHLLDELGKLATKYGVLSSGMLVEEITARQLQELCRSYLKITVDEGIKTFQTLRAAYPDMEIERYDNVLIVRTPVEDVSKITRLLVNADIGVYEIKTESIGLEEYFFERLDRYDEAVIKA